MSASSDAQRVLHHGANDTQLARLEKRMAAIRYKLMVLSGKGGVGKSTVATNLAIALAQRGLKIGLFDADLHGPSVPTLLDVPPGAFGADGDEILPAQVGEHMKVASMGFLMPTSRTSTVWRGPQKYHAIQQLLRDVRWGELDCLIIDCPPGTGDEPLDVVQLIGRPAGALIVTTPQKLAITDVQRCVGFCEKVALPILGIVENMSGYVCPKCGHSTEPFSSGGGKRLADEIAVPFWGAVPIDPAIMASGDAGCPIAAGDTSHPITRQFDQFAEKLIAAMNQMDLDADKAEA